MHTNAYKCIHMYTNTYNAYACTYTRTPVHETEQDLDQRFTRCPSPPAVRSTEAEPESETCRPVGLPDWLSVVHPALGDTLAAHSRPHPTSAWTSTVGASQPAVLCRAVLCCAAPLRRAPAPLQLV
jgi:hypothetical protein